MATHKQKKQEKSENNFAGGGNMGAGKSGHENLGTETTHEEQGSHKPGTGPTRNAAPDRAEQQQAGPPQRRGSKISNQRQANRNSKNNI